MPVAAAQAGGLDPDHRARRRDGRIRHLPHLGLRPERLVHHSTHPYASLGPGTNLEPARAGFGGEAGAGFSRLGW
ncbi:hypothetical protein GCM10009530_18160 [Microbispora corallina]